MINFKLMNDKRETPKKVFIPENKKAIIFFLAIIFLVGATARFYNLKNHGVIFVDEVGAYYFPALKIAFSQDPRGIIGYPLHTVLMAMTLKLFGVLEIDQAYYYALLYPATLSSLTVILLYFIGKSLFNYQVGIFAAASLALMEYHMFYGKTIMAESGVVFWGTLVLLMLCLAFETRLETKQANISWLRISLVAISLGLGISLKPTTVFFAIPVGLFFFLVLVKRSISLKESFFALLLLSSLTYLTILGINKLLILLNFFNLEIYEEGIKHGWHLFARLGWNPYWSIPPFMDIIWYRLDKITLFLLAVGVGGCLGHFRDVRYLWPLLSIPVIALAFSFWQHLTPARAHVSIIPFLALLSGIGAQVVFRKLINLIQLTSRKDILKSHTLLRSLEAIICLVIIISGFIHARDTVFLSSGYVRAAELLMEDHFNKGIQLDNLSLRIHTSSNSIDTYQQRWFGQGEVKELDYLDTSGSVELFLNEIPQLINDGFTHFVFDFNYIGWTGPGGSYANNIRELLRRFEPTFVVPNPAGSSPSTLAENASDFKSVLSQIKDPIVKNIYIYRLKDLIKNDKMSVDLDNKNP